MKIVSWNIDSLNAALTSDSNRAQMSRKTLQQIADSKPDFLCLQETKLNKLLPNQEKILSEMFPGYHVNATYSTSKKGYAGTMILSREQVEMSSPKITDGALEEIDGHGRITTVFTGDFYLVNVYTPNSSNGLKNLPNRMEWDKYFCKYVNELREKAPVVICGDLNVAHKEIDLKNPAGNHFNPGFSDEEREGFSNLLDSGFVDIFREKLGDEHVFYTWWSQVSKTAKANNSGWRIDYFLADEEFYKENEDKFSGSVVDTGERADHAPLALKF